MKKTVVLIFFEYEQILWKCDLNLVFHFFEFPKSLKTQKKRRFGGFENLSKYIL